MKFIAHRGESLAARENTLEAFQLAWAGDVSAVELDVHLSRDGQVVVMHDANLRRTCGVDASIKNLTLEEIKLLNPGIPALREVLDIMPRNGEIFIELKAGTVLLEPLKKLFAGYPPAGERLHFLTGAPEVKLRFPAHRVYWCLSNYIPAGTRFSPPELLAEITRLHADGVSMWYGSGITVEYIDALHSADLQCIAWTVDIPWDAQCLRNAGVDGVTSNRAADLKKELSERVW